jgi:hypothetical protein
MAHSRICSIPDCGKPHYGRGWCRNHYAHCSKHGDPLAGKFDGPWTAKPGEPMRHFKEVVLRYDGDECLIWPFYRGKKGYARLRYDGVQRQVSRLVCEAVNGPPPSDDCEAAHSCGNGHLGCVAKRHLSWKTKKGNADDRDRHGRTARGEKNGCAKLTEEEIRTIRSLRGSQTGKEVAKMFGVCPATISAIQLRQKWTHV